MKYLPIALGALVVTALIFSAMWVGWRARARRDSPVGGEATGLTGEVIDRFDDLMYVSTTPVGEPLVRVSAPGLRYRGPAEVIVREDGVSLTVRGESPVLIASGQLRGCATAARRIGKAVERGGLSLLLWEADGRSLESSFRLAGDADRRRFSRALERFADPPPNPRRGEPVAHERTDAPEENR